MFFQKIQSALISLFIIPFVLPLFFPYALDLSYGPSVAVYLLYAIPIVFIYGTFTSILSEYISQKTPFRSKRVTSFVFHLIAGWLFVVPYGLLFDPSIFETGIFNLASLLGVSSAFIFYAVDQLLGHHFKTL
ncbi:MULTISPECIES: hypothetical protein [unclassified Exiguobacterium]|uniref:hypothetical protein n=1 Tax=unclassified Exiguobacterium TaxID=2644629 RepID=UPI001039343F|nr:MULTISPECIES: hypothetical protein [unclassified Exiguobacterium]TCI72484.1 hypothetical protein EVJ19_03425 [Exiguobacterium sp. IPCI3]TCI81882.1 hypothetical protein EVJ18_03425 [Exiguobacterium sp. IPCH1]TCI83388.1 hypothetical protein EVJ17_03425 [Exiguobacterium sp. IPBC4]